MTPLLLTIADVAERLAVSPKTVSRLLASGALKRLKIGSSTRIALEDLNNYVARLQGVEAPGARPASPGQIGALHAKTNALDAASKAERGTSKRRALEHASASVGRAITSSKDLTFAEMSELLDWLDTGAEPEWL